MISKSTAKFIKSLQLKKYRKLEQMFLVEGRKSVFELLDSDFSVKQLVCTEAFYDQYRSLLESFVPTLVSEVELGRLGTLKTNNTILAVAEMQPQKYPKISSAGYTLALDGINDPGNLGTIIRVADWFGIKNIVASEDTADLYNPKVISATKGSFTRVKLSYLSLKEFLQQYEGHIYAADMHGQNVHITNFGSGGVLVMGNEANGISESLDNLVTHRITIPAYGKAESLNVAMATAIICDNVMRTISEP